MLLLFVWKEEYLWEENKNEGFAFTDVLLGEGIHYETTDSLQRGIRTWILARLPHQYIINGEEITLYLVFMNCHDGSGSIEVAMIPIRVVCQNTLKIVQARAKRSWSCNHTEDIASKMDEAIPDWLIPFANKDVGNLF